MYAGPERRRRPEHRKAVEALRQTVAGGLLVDALVVEDGMTVPDRIEAALEAYRLGPVVVPDVPRKVRRA